MPDQYQRHQRKAAPIGIPQSACCQCCNQHQEQIQQCPTGNPAVRHIIHTAGRQQTPAWRQVQLGADGVKVLFPTHRADRVDSADGAAIGIQRYRAGSDFHALLAGFILSNKLVAAV